MPKWPRRVNSKTAAAALTSIGRGGRKLIYFKDESAHYEHPEMIEAAWEGICALDATTFRKTVEQVLDVS